MGKLSKALEKIQVKEESYRPGDGEEKTIGEILPAGPAPQHSTRDAGDWLKADGEGMVNWDARLRIAMEATSPVSESFRRLRSKIIHGSSGKRPKTLLVTSHAPGEGKGFVSVNLGVAIAKGMEHHALLVDCDLRKPTLARIFGISNESGLVDHLQNGVDLAHLIRKTGLAKLSVIPSGKPPANPAELLDSKRMVSLLQELASRYEDRFIIFDSPPSIVASEVISMAQQVDGVVLVVRWGISPKAELSKLVEAIGKDKIVGVVFNAYEESELDRHLLKKKSYNYYGGYY